MPINDYKIIIAEKTSINSWFGYSMDAWSRVRFSDYYSAPYDWKSMV